MAVIPNTRLEQLIFAEAHLPVWNTTPAAIGLTAAQVTALTSLIQEARKDFDASVAARDASKAATEAMYGSIGQMRDQLAAMVRSIKTFAEASADPAAVYSAAAIPAPLPPSQTPPPGKPFEFRVEVLDFGALRINWKCDNPEGVAGTVYEVFRGAQGSPLQYVGITGSREFVDETIPRSILPMVYRITAVRSTRRGDPASLSVVLGVAGGGGLTIASAEGAEIVKPTIAA